MYGSFSKQHIRELKALIGETEFRFDVMGNLPAELVQLVVQHLSLCQIFQCRRVSHKWSHILCDGSLIKTVLEPWRSKGDFRLDIRRGTTSKQALDLIAEHQKAFRTGIAFSTMTMTINSEVAIRGHVSYSEGYLAWGENEESGTEIAVHNIKTGKRLSRVMPSREAIHCLAVSSTLLAAVSFRARCYVWAHSSDGKPCSVRLPSGRITSVRVFSNTVILHLHTLNDSETENCQDSFVLIRCSMETQWRTSLSPSHDEPLSAKTSEISVNNPYRDSAPHFVIDSTGTNVIVICRLRGTKDAGLFLSYYDLEGKLEFEGLIPGLRNGTLGDSTLNIIESSSTKSENLFHIWSLSRITNSLAGKYWEPLEYTHAVYYPSRRTIKIQSQSLLDGETKMMYDEPALLWKGILYSNMSGAYLNAETAMRIVDLERRIEGYHDSYTLPAADRGRDRVYQIFGDEIFIVQLCDQFADVCCFDRNVKMIGEYSES